MNILQIDIKKEERGPNEYNLNGKSELITS